MTRIPYQAQVQIDPKLAIQKLRSLGYGEDSFLYTEHGGLVFIRIEPPKDKFPGHDTVAAKTFLPPSGVKKEDFRREIENLEVLRGHENIPTFLGVEIAEDAPSPHFWYLIREWIPDACNLEEFCASLPPRQPMTEFEFLDLVRLSAGALSYAHSKDILHLALKPANILVRSRGRGVDGIDVWVTEFRGPGRVGNRKLASPEQLSGKDGDQRSDVYSLGKILAALLTSGRVSLQNDWISKTLKRACDERPEARYPTIDDFICDFGRAIPRDLLVAYELRELNGATTLEAIAVAISRMPGTSPIEELRAMNARIREVVRSTFSGPIEKYLNTNVSGRAFSDESRNLATAVSTLLEATNCRLECPKCGEPSVLRVMADRHAEQRFIYQHPSGGNHSAKLPAPSDSDDVGSSAGREPERRSVGRLHLIPHRF